MKIDDRCLQLAIAAAKEAGRIQKLYYGRSHQVMYKGDINPVTEVDTLCERAIIQMILDAFPDHDLLTEERPFEGKGSPWKWIIDPLDGTTNYFHGFPCFCVSIGLEVEGEVRLGVVYNPLLDELFHAEKGKGAFLNRNQIRVSRADHLDRSFLSTGFPYDVREHTDFYLRYFWKFISKSFAVRRPGSAALDLSYLVAGSLMVTEAGGKVTDFQGRPFDIYSEETLASNGLIHQEMLQVIQEIDSTKGDEGLGFGG
jgi:myo-inositol-1(or 4)-monophosphatase